MNATRQNVIARANELGCTITHLGVTVSGRMWEGLVDAPKGKVFASNGCHFVTVSVFCGKGAAEAVYKAILDDMEMGLETCEDPDCEYCKEQN